MAARRFRAGHSPYRGPPASEGSQRAFMSRHRSVQPCAPERMLARRRAGDKCRPPLLRGIDQLQRAWGQWGSKSEHSCATSFKYFPASVCLFASVWLRSASLPLCKHVLLQSDQLEEHQLLAHAKCKVNVFSEILTIERITLFFQKCSHCAACLVVSLFQCSSDF